MPFSSKVSSSQVPPILYGNIRLQQVFEHKHLLISHIFFLTPTCQSYLPHILLISHISLLSLNLYPTYPRYLTTYHPHIILIFHISFLSSTYPSYLPHIILISHISFLSLTYHSYLTHILLISDISFLSPTYHSDLQHTCHNFYLSPTYLPHILLYPTFLPYILLISHISSLSPNISPTYPPYLPHILLISQHILQFPCIFTDILSITNIFLRNV